MTKTIFISYSHDDESHKLWVKRFADDLRDKGNFDVLLDQYLPKGASWTRFMQNGIKDADRVLVIGTPNYRLRSMATGGVAFEESIISNEFLNDIDSTKFYPILRKGAFAEAFPPILAGRNGDDFRDDSHYDEMLEAVISEIRGIGSKLSFSNESVAKPKVKVSLSINFLLETYMGRPTGLCEGLGLTVTITNLSEHPMFFYEPHFEFDQPVFDGKNAFSTTEHLPDDNRYPVRLEYGEISQRTYILRHSNISFWENLQLKNSDLHFSAFAVNTLEEIYQSDGVLLKHLLNDLRKCYNI